jgi:hypothetical protein
MSPPNRNGLDENAPSWDANTDTESIRGLGIDESSARRSGWNDGGADLQAIGARGRKRGIVITPLKSAHNSSFEIDRDLRGGTTTRTRPRCGRKPTLSRRRGNQRFQGELLLYTPCARTPSGLPHLSSVLIGSIVRRKRAAARGKVRNQIGVPLSLASWGSMQFVSLFRWLSASLRTGSHRRTIQL